jgi:phosphoribosyl-AMP cyclohydrolase / phosphoribosyl-ATP pyrophosphohydrolase
MIKMTPSDLERQVLFDNAGLVPCIVQSVSGEVRMLGYMNAASLAQSLETGLVTFFSRSRQALWVKGETSGHTLTLHALCLDCDRDTLLATATCAGPTCHTGSTTCFGEAAQLSSFVLRLEQTLKERKANANPNGSYTEKLFFAGTDRIAKKVVEEAGEVVLAAKTFDHAPESSGREEARAALIGEAADLLFHLTMLLTHEGISLAEVEQVLSARHRTSGAD